MHYMVNKDVYILAVRSASRVPYIDGSSKISLAHRKRVTELATNDIIDKFGHEN